MTTRLALAAALLALSAAALAQTPDPAAPSKVTGTVVYRERIALPEDATVRVRLLDASDPELPPKPVAETTIPTRGKQVPIPFEISYAAGDVKSSRRYVVSATILAEGRTLFASRSRYPVITRGAPTKVEILVQPPAGGRPVRPKADAASPPLEGTVWTLVELGGKPPVDGPGARTAELALDSETHGIAGSTGCNRFMGTYALADGKLSLLPGGMTMMACPEDVMAQEQAFLAALRSATGYRIAGGRLELLAGDGVAARFAPPPSGGAEQSH